MGEERGVEEEGIGGADVDSREDIDDDRLTSRRKTGKENSGVEASASE